MSRSLPLIPDAELARNTSPSMAGDEPGFGALRTEKGHLPLEAMDVRGRIDGLLARVVVCQTFVNAFEEPLEAAYIFPLPDRAAVTRFRLMVAGREIEGILEERGQAREHYDQAIALGQRASIAEEDRPGVFNLRVGNLMPGERATVELTLCGVLPYADGEVTFRFPLVVAPRYIPGRPLPGPSVGDGTAMDTTAVPDASRISPPVLLPGFPNPVRLSLELELHDGGAGADGVCSSLHAVQEDARDGYRRIRVQPGERLDRDFILRFQLGGADIHSTLTLHPDANGNEGTFALTVVPPTSPANGQSRPRDVVFVLDRSGSMEGWKMIAARRAVARMIDTLGDADTFCVLAFDSSVETPKNVPTGLSPAADRNRFRAVEFLATVEARGGTEMAEPLDRAVKLLATSVKVDRDRILVLITDGQVGNEDQLLETLGKRIEKIRVFTIGIDRAVNEGFLRRLAERGGGSYELVESEDRLDQVMANVHRRIGTPLLTGLNLEPERLAIEPGEVVPRRLPDLFAGSPLLILGRYRGRPEGSIAIRGTNSSGAAQLESVAGQVRDNPAIAAAWARGQIRKLEDRYAAGDRDRSTLEKATVAISLRFHVLCRFTAYVAIDRSQVVNESGSLHRITQPVEMPKGWAGAGAMPLQRKFSAVRRQSGGQPEDLVLPCMSAPSPKSSPLPPSPAAFAMPRGEVTHHVTDFDASVVPGTGHIPVPGRTLADRLRSDGRIPPAEAAALAAELADALQVIHDQGLVHRALTPMQIVLDSGGHPRILGQPVSASEVLDASTLRSRSDTAYLPPECFRIESKSLDHRGDIYTLGVILYEMLVGRCPFNPKGPWQEQFRRIVQGDVTRPRRLNRSIPAKLDAICLKAMSKDPAARYATARELAAALREFMSTRRKAFWK